MNSTHQFAPALRAALLVAALALGGCGRKAGLDLPPGAAVQSSAPEPADGTPTARPNDIFNSGSSIASDAAPAAAKGRKRSFILDPLLND